MIFSNYSHEMSLVGGSHVVVPRPPLPVPSCTSFKDAVDGIHPGIFSKYLALAGNSCLSCASRHPKPTWVYRGGAGGSPSGHTLQKGGKSRVLPKMHRFFGCLCSSHPICPQCGLPGSEAALSAQGTPEAFPQVGCGGP